MAAYDHWILRRGYGKGLTNALAEGWFATRLDELQEDLDKAYAKALVQGEAEQMAEASNTWWIGAGGGIQSGTAVGIGGNGGCGGSAPRHANVGEWVEEVEVQRPVTETVKLYPGARVISDYAGVEWVLLSDGWSEKLYWATPKDGYLSRASDSGGDSALYVDVILSKGDATKRYFLNHTVTKTVTVTETKRTPVGAGSVFEGDGTRVVLVKMNPTPVRYFQGGWGLLYPTGGVDTGPDLTLSLDSQLKFLKSCGYRLVEAKGV